LSRALQDKLVVLTGASRGIGVAIAEDLAAAGAHLILSARNEEKLNAVAHRVRELGGQATVVPCDVSAAADLERLASTSEALGPVHVLINNAGVERPVPIGDQSVEEIQRQLDVNLRAPILLTRRMLPAMVAKGSGVVVMMSSMAGKAPVPYNSVYSATKHGINGFTASLRAELNGTGIHVGVVCPSYVADAGMWAEGGVKAPSMLPEVSLQSVVRATRRVINGSREVLVTPSPIRPFLAMAQLFPSLDGFVLTRLGVVQAMHERAKKEGGNV
jgi:short-subunit dehydrogenase